MTNSLSDKNIITRAAVMDIKESCINMIDVSQWRSSIGLWYSSCQPFYCLRSVKSSTVLGQSEREQLLSSLIEILLILSGNVELNPGPMTDDVRKILQDVLRKKFAVLSEAIKHCVPRTAELMHSSGLISGYQVDTNNGQSMIDEFDKGMPFKNDVSELHCHCQLFLDCLSCQGDRPLEVAQHLAKIWTERIQQELKISLSFDIKNVPVETTPSSTSSSGPIMPASTSPQMGQLLDWLKPLVEWEDFAIYLPGMTNVEIEIIKRNENAVNNQKRALYSKWLEVCPTASWNDVITALERDRKMALADDVRRKLTEIQSSSNSLTEDRREDTSSGTDIHMEISTQNKDGVAVNNEPIEVTLLPDEEKEIEKNLINLHKKFTRLEVEFKNGLKQFIRNERGTILDIIDYIERFTRSDDPILRSCTTIDDLMRHFNNYYDFLECRVLAETAENFVSPNLACEFQTHLHEAKEFRNSASVKTLREHLNKIYKPYIHNPENAPKALIDMHTAWDDVTIEGLYKLMRRFYPRNDSLLKNIEITASSVHIVCYMTDQSQDEIKQIIEYCQQNASIMRYIGIFGLEINGVIILDDQHEDEHYTFEYGLLKAAEDGHNEAVQFLVELGIDVNHVTEEGQTPLTLAITNGHGHVMETLISAGANVNPQVKRTPLAIAVKREDPLELTRYLLDHGAHCNVLIDGTSILDMTSHEETRQLLYQHNAAMTTQELIAIRYSELRDKLEELTANVRKCLNDLLSASNITLTEVKDQVIDYISPDTRCESVEELLVLLQPFCSIFNVNPLKSVAEKFLECEIMADFDDYSKNLNDFEMSTKLRHVVHVMCVASDIQPISSSNVTIKFNSQWKDRPLADVRKLHEHCFISIHQFLTLTDVNEEDSKIVLTYKVPSSPQCSPVISTEQQQFMKQIGICEVIVNDIILLVNDDDQEMSLERVLQQAVDDNNDNLISFLMDINVTISDEPHHGQSSSSSQSAPHEQLMSAASTGDNDTVKSLLDQNIVDVNYCNEDGKTPLMVAAENNHLDVVETLLLAGASKLVNHQSNNGGTALMLASLFGHLEVVKCLLIKSANPNIQLNNNITALLAASCGGHYQIVEILLQNDADININDESPIFPTPLSVAIIENHIEVIHVLLAKISQHSINNLNKAMMTAVQMNRHEVLRLLLEAGVNPNFNFKFDSQTLQQLNNEDFRQLDLSAISTTPFEFKDAIEFLLTFLQKENIDRFSLIPLMQSALLGHIEIVDLLLQYNADPNAVDIAFGRNALHMAAAHNHPDIVDKLLSAGALIDRQSNHGWTALMLASQNGHLEVVKCLLTERVDINVQNNDGWTALMAASANGHLEVVKCLLTEGVDFNVQNNKGATAFAVASANGHLEVVKCLLMEGVDINVQNNNGWTALMAATLNGHLEVVKYLLTEGVDINVQTNDGETALMAASGNGHLEVVKCLLTEEVDFNVQNNNGWTALMLASRNGHLEVVKCLLTEGVDINVQANNGWTALMLASRNGHLEVVKCLLTEGVDINVKNNKGATAFIVASAIGHLEVVKCLLMEGVDINVQANNGWTAFMAASGNGHLEVVKCLLTEGVDINVQTNDGGTALMAASGNGHLEVVKCLLIKSANPNIQLNNNITALLAASCGGHYQIVEILLQNDADININDESPIFPTPLSVAIIENHIEVIHVLLAKISQHSINNLNKAMMAAVVMNRHEVLRLLLKAGVSPNFDFKCDSQTLQQLNNEHFRQLEFDLSNTPFKSILQFIPDESKDDPIKFVLTFLQKENINRLSMIPLMQSALLGHIEMVDLLLQYNADPNAVDIEFGYNALHVAANYNHPDIVDKLLSAGALIDHQSNDGLTALMVASVYCHLEVVKCLLIRQANPDFVNKDGFTALTLMCFSKATDQFFADHNTIQRLKLHHIPMIELLLDANASHIVTFSDGRKLSSLTVAAYANNLDAVNVLMGRVEFSNELITHALIAACYVGNPSVINALSHKITNLPYKDLLLSCAEGDIAGVISAIYESNINPDTPLACGLTPLMVASSCGHIELIDALIQAGADINLPNEYGHTPLDIVDHEYIIHPPNQDVISILVEHGAAHKNPVDDDKLHLCYPTNNLGTDDIPSSTEVNKPNILVKLMQRVQLTLQLVTMQQMASVSQIHQPQFAI